MVMFDADKWYIIYPFIYLVSFHLQMIMSLCIHLYRHLDNCLMTISEVFIYNYRKNNSCIQTCVWNETH